MGSPGVARYAPGRQRLSKTATLSAYQRAVIKTAPRGATAVPSGPQVLYRMCTSQRALLSHHWVHSGRTHSLSRPGGLPTRARPEATNGHSTDLYTPRQSTPTSIRCRPDRPAAPATSWRRSARLEAPGAPKIAEPATSSSQQPDWASDPPPRRPEMVSPTPEAWHIARGGQPSHPAPPRPPSASPGAP